MGDLSKNFSRSEFACKGDNCCGNSSPVQPELISALQALRDQLNLPLVIKSGFRCNQYNASIKCTPNNFHTLGMAADVVCPDGLTADELAKAAETIPEFQQGDIEINDPSYVHLDVLRWPLHFELLPNGRNAKLIKNYKIRIARNKTITVPAGFETDFASSPRCLWSIFPPWGRYSPAAVVHDFLYYTGEITRKDADRIFYYLAKKLNVPTCRRVLSYIAIRRFGCCAWKRARRLEKKI